MRQPRTALEQGQPTFDTQKMTKMRKNDVKMIDPKIIQNHSQEVPGPSGHQKTWKNNVEHPQEPLRGVQKKWRNFDSNPSFWWLFRPKILIFAMLTHVLPCGSLSGKSGDSQKTYSRTSKMVGYFELSVPLSEHFLHESEKWDFWSRTPLEHLQIDLNLFLHI